MNDIETYCQIASMNRLLKSKNFYSILEGIKEKEMQDAKVIDNIFFNINKQK